MRKIILAVLALVSISTLVFAESSSTKRINLVIDLNSRDLQVVKDGQLIQDHRIWFRSGVDCKGQSPIKGSFSLTSKSKEYFSPSRNINYKNVLLYKKSFMIAQLPEAADPLIVGSPEAHDCHTIKLKKESLDEVFENIKGYKNSNVAIEIHE